MKSLEKRLHIALFAVVLLVLAIIWAIASHFIADLSEDVIASRLEHDAESLLSAITLDQGAVRIDDSRVSQIYRQPLSGHYFVIKTADDVQVTSRSLWDQVLTVRGMLQPGQVERYYLDGPQAQKLLVWAKGFIKQSVPITVTVAEDISPIQQESREFSATYALITLAGLLLILVVQNRVIRASFRKLDTVREEIKQLATGDRQTLSEQVPTEVLPLVSEFNRLLKLMSERLQRSRNSVGNLAHAIKGPLTLLMRQFDDDEQSNATKHAQRISQLMERELQRARLAGEGVSTQAFDAQKELPDIISMFRQIYRDKDIQYSVHISRPAKPFGDREDMLELFGNLIENASKWAIHSVRVSVSFDEDILISIVDDGDPLSDEELNSLGVRGKRLDESVQGHGLGLSIVKDIVESYAGTINFKHSSQLSGLQVECVLPLTSIRNFAE